MKKILNGSIIFIFFTLLIGGCEDISPESNGVLIRIQNNSTYPMKEVTAIFPEDEIHYGDISSGEKSTYHQVTKAYRYAYIETVVNDKELVLQPIDYVGESLLDSGLYTYELNLDEETFNSENFRYSLSLQLTEEE